MTGRNCVAIACDLRLGMSAVTISNDFPKIWQYADRVFVIFQRLHSKNQYDGTGIGLALCKKIVEYHGGSIWLDKDRAEGSAVHWTLPVSSEPEAATPGAADPDRKVVSA